MSTVGAVERRSQTGPDWAIGIDDGCKIGMIANQGRREKESHFSLTTVNAIVCYTMCVTAQLVSPPVLLRMHAHVDCRNGRLTGPDFFVAVTH